MTSIPSATVWGSPTARKHALLIHGLTSSSHTWHRVASSLAGQAGFLVTAPNLIGHGLRRATDYHMDLIVEDLRPYLSARNYDLIIGHSLGGVTVMSLFPHLSQSHPTAIILVDPPLQQGAEKIAVKDAIFSASCINIKDAGAYLAENPLWAVKDTIYRELGTRLADPEAVHGIYKRNQPWNFLHHFEKTSTEWKVAVLISDPAIQQTCFIDDLQPFPHVRPVHVPNAGHWIQYEFPEIVVEEALKTVAELKAV
ncbi:Alpha/Beta hydrolase protein [Boletus edulis BED1]|uniref:Alpha/Beta hydrolase protein n=1 Tax=Boletus edulis BED1 TaxID=1328754 RepID=A0AAD4C6H6_BOLED|nr:Alpha/Beta hydrolase protein [Boletus edulis BED1]